MNKRTQVSMFSDEISTEKLIRERFSQIKDSLLPSTEIGWHAWQFDAVLNAIDNIEGQKILDLGCGKGRFVVELRKYGAEVYGLDITWKFVRIAARNISNGVFLQGSATVLPFKDNVFDNVICLEVLEHIPIPQNAIREMVRVVNPGGRIVIIDKNRIGVDERYFIPMCSKKFVMEVRNKYTYPRWFPFRERWFAPREVLRWLHEAGCSPEIIYPRSCKYKRLKFRKVFFSRFPQLVSNLVWVGTKKK